MTASNSSQVAIIGAGPYGLAAAAHLRAAGIETRVFGEAMEFWDKQMPAGMCLRSVWSACQISDPRRQLTLDGYESAHRVSLSRPVTLEDFVSYGRWFQSHTVPDLDPRRVISLEPAANGFRLSLGDGDFVRAQRVVVATGISTFQWRPPQFDGLPPELASHSADNRELSQYAGRRVAVIGGGQAALESAALLHECGAEVEVIARQSAIRWLDQRATWLKSPANPLRPFLYPPTDVGPPILNQIVAAPDLFRRLPRGFQDKITYRSTRPAGAGWLVPRLADVPIRTSLSVVAAKRVGDRVELTLDDETQRSVDHVLISTGFRVDVARYGFLSSALVKRLQIEDGYPILTAGLESASVPGLHFLGAPAVRSYGPLCRFVSGTDFAARALTRRVVSSRVTEDQRQPAEVLGEAVAAE
jgi:thioredoxin reductase